MEATAERHFHSVLVIRDRFLECGEVIIESMIEGIPVGPCDIGDVFRGFESAFNFERVDSGLDELRDQFESGEVLRAEEVTFITEIFG